MTNHEQWVADAKKMARLLHVGLAMTFLRQQINTGEDKLNEAIVDLALAMDQDRGIDYFDQLEATAKLRLLESAAMGLMLVNIELSEELATRITQAAQNQ